MDIDEINLSKKSDPTKNLTIEPGVQEELPQSPKTSAPFDYLKVSP